LSLLERLVCLLLGHQHGESLYGYTSLPSGRRPQDFELMERIGYQCGRCGRKVIERGRLAR